MAIDPHIPGRTCARRGVDRADAAREPRARRRGKPDRGRRRAVEDAAVEWSRPISLLWIDGDHEYESARSDFKLWEPHLRPDAVVAFHDTFVMEGRSASSRSF